jgi:hypothetical protein
MFTMPRRSYSVLNSEVRALNAMRGDRDDPAFAALEEELRYFAEISGYLLIKEFTTGDTVVLSHLRLRPGRAIQFTPGRVIVQLPEAGS